MKTYKAEQITPICLATLVFALFCMMPAAAQNSNVRQAGSAAASAADLCLGAGDLRLEARADGCYLLYIRAKPGIASVLLTESTRDPARKSDNFAYRSNTYNPVNGDEKRILNGKILDSAYSRYSLVSSTPRPDAQLGRAFQILIPSVLIYGYPWSRSGAIAVGKGTFLNIRTFAKAYADYSGSFYDNPYTLNLARKPVPELPPEPQAAANPRPNAEPEIQIVEKPPAEDKSTSGKFDAIIGDGKGQSLDLVICLDTTDSMVPYIEDIRKGLAPILKKRAAEYSSCRIGLVLYKDYWPDDYICQKYPFTTDISEIMKPVREAKIGGGRDVPEALFEALYSAVADFDWKADKRDIIFLTDASPHARPKGDILFSHVVAAAAALKIDIEAVIEPSEGFKPKNDVIHYPLEHIRARLENISTRQAKQPAVLVLSDMSAAGAGSPAKSSSIMSYEDETIQNIRGGHLAAFLTFAKLRPVAAQAWLNGPAGINAKPRAGSVCWFALRDKEALDLGRRSRADFVLLIMSLAPAANGAAPLETSRISETVARLIEVKSGREIERDTIWRAGLPSGAVSEFVNGSRNK